tara:strand:+ start:3385 stop:4731 length:1347 start_codon:yes stop_codon:yes gene_type:complete
MKVRTRFAPSPTGYLHVGGLRTALYNYLFSKQLKGQFILRIEDTDQNRYVENATENLINILTECGLNYDIGPNKEDESGPYIQSKRLDIYKKYYLELINNEFAYVCFDQGGELIPEFNIKKALQKIKIEKYVIKLKVKQDSELVVNDMIRGEIKFDLNLIEDPIIIKSDGYPTYHFANVIDDHLMKISHVIRGEEWISSLPKHILLYKSFGWDIPIFCHLPLLLNEDKSKLSKRQGDVAVEDFINKGYLKNALINFVALLGWHPENDNEFFSLEELVKNFSIDKINKSGAIFDREKLLWMNREYIKMMNSEDLKKIIQKKLESINIFHTKVNLDKITSYCKDRISTFEQILDEIQGFYILEKNEEIRNFDYKNLFQLWIKELGQVEDLNKEIIDDIIMISKNELDISGKNLFIPLRIALISKTHGPDIFTLINILGIEESIKRLKRFD